MFKKIVVGMDGSERADHAFDVAAEVALANSGSITIAHVDEETIGKGGGSIRADEPERAAALKEKAERMSESGVETQVSLASVFTGGPGPAIASIAAESGADLIVVGTRGHGGMSGALIGSVAHKLLSVAHVPVLVVPDPAPTPVKAEAATSTAAAG
jgi:nucleotide-binding universal stress UspA family protein